MPSSSGHERDYILHRHHAATAPCEGGGHVNTVNAHVPLDTLRGVAGWIIGHGIYNSTLEEGAVPLTENYLGNS